jgi:hypothetical protein
VSCWIESSIRKFYTMPIGFLNGVRYIAGIGPNSAGLDLDDEPAHRITYEVFRELMGRPVWKGNRRYSIAIQIQHEYRGLRRFLELQLALLGIRKSRRTPTGADRQCR